MKTYAEIRHELEEALDNRRAQSDVGNLFDESEKATLEFLNYEINGVNSLPNQETIREFKFDMDKSRLFVRGGVGSFGVMFTENSEYPENMDFDLVRSNVKSIIRKMPGLAP